MFFKNTLQNFTQKRLRLKTNHHRFVHIQIAIQTSIRYIRTFLALLNQNMEDGILTIFLEKYVTV